MGVSECINWPFGKDGNGYAKVFWNGKRDRGHRVVCERFNGVPFDGAEAAHKCGNPSCVNPDHIRWATRSENQKDRVAHGTSNRGENHGNSKLTLGQVEEIASLKGEMSSPEIAKMYGVSASHVRSIQTKRKWKHV